MGIQAVCLVLVPPIRAAKLIDVTFEAMMRGIETVQPGATFGDIGHAIQVFAERRDFLWFGIFAAMELVKFFTQNLMLCIMENREQALN